MTDIAAGAPQNTPEAAAPWSVDVLTLFPDMFPVRSPIRWPAARWRTGSGGSMRLIFAPLRAINTASWTMPPSAVVPAW